LQQHQGRQQVVSSLASAVGSARILPSNFSQQPLTAKRSRAEPSTQATAAGANQWKQRKRGQASSSQSSSSVVSLGSMPGGGKQRGPGHVSDTRQFNFYEDGAGSWDHDSLGIDGVREVSMQILRTRNYMTKHVQHRCSCPSGLTATRLVLAQPFMPACTLLTFSTHSRHSLAINS
jgi:hypothetical protein